MDEELSLLARDLEEVLTKLKTIVDHSIQLRSQEIRRDAVNTIWGNFLAAFMNYAKKSSQEKGQSFFQGISLNRISGR